MGTLVMIDGCLYSPPEARVSVFDRGFLYGDSVFETVRTYHGVPFRLYQHLERLERSAQLVRIALPVSLEVLGTETRTTLEQAFNPESYVRIMVTRGQGELGLAPGVAQSPLRVIIVAPLRTPPPEAYSRGVSVVTYRTQRAADSSPAAGAKVANYLVSVLALQEAQNARAAEALVVDRDGAVVEGSSSNVFVVQGQTLVTPPEEAGILPGITRACVLEVARELGIAVELRRLPLAELLAADEVFISSSVRELVPVVKVDEKQIGDGRPGRMTLVLLEHFRRRVLAEIAQAR